jgi:hypothetical protein
MILEIVCVGALPVAQERALRFDELLLSVLAYHLQGTLGAFGFQHNIGFAGLADKTKP